MVRFMSGHSIIGVKGREILMNTREIFFVNNILNLDAYLNEIIT